MTHFLVWKWWLVLLILCHLKYATMRMWPLLLTCGVWELSATYCKLCVEFYESSNVSCKSSTTPCKFMFCKLHTLCKSHAIFLFHKLLCFLNYLWSSVVLCYALSYVPQFNCYFQRKKCYIVLHNVNQPHFYILLYFHILLYLYILLYFCILLYFESRWLL